METSKAAHRIAIDCMGGDMGPSEIVAGIAIALKDGLVSPEDHLVLVGNEEILRQLTREHRIRLSANISYRHAPGIIAPDDSPMSAMKGKKDASMLVAIEMLKAGEVDAIVSTFRNEYLAGINKSYW